MNKLEKKGNLVYKRRVKFYSKLRKSALLITTSPILSRLCENFEEILRIRFLHAAPYENLVVILKRAHKNAPLSRVARRKRTFEGMGQASKKLKQKKGSIKACKPAAEKPFELQP